MNLIDTHTHTHTHTQILERNEDDRVLLIDYDSTIPNLALMHLSTYFRERNIPVGFNIDDPNKVFASIVFTKNQHLADGLPFAYPNAQIDIGGSGVSLDKSLPIDIDRLMPDYSLYPDWEHDLGMTTRGCTRNCYFCFVPKKEGQFRRFQHPSEFHHPDHKSAVLMDNNILADPDWFFEVTDWYIERKMKVDFNQGLDIRYMTPEIARQIKKVRRLKHLKFAFDSMSYKDELESGIGMLYDAGINLRSCAMFYVYCHNDAQVDNAIERCKLLKSHNCLPYVMINREVEKTQRMTDIKRWTRPQIFFKTDYEDYSRSFKSQHNNNN